MEPNSSAVRSQTEFRKTLPKRGPEWPKTEFRKSVTNAGSKRPFRCLDFKWHQQFWRTTVSELFGNDCKLGAGHETFISIYLWHRAVCRNALSHRQSIHKFPEPNIHKIWTKLGIWVSFTFFIIQDDVKKAFQSESEPQPSKPKPQTQPCLKPPNPPNPPL